jgi:glycosyltransferase involved in cell wall biosynthesis
MKILLIAHLLPYPPKGGSPLRNYNLLKEIASRHEVHMLTFHQRAHAQHGSSIEEAKEEIEKLCAHLEVFDIPTDFSRGQWYALLFRNLFSLTPYSVWRYWSKEMEEAIKRQVAEQDFDVIHFDTIALADFARLASKTAKVLNHHNIESQLLYRRAAYVSNPFTKLYFYYQAWKLRRFERNICEVMDLQVTVSENDRQTLLQYCSDAEIAVVPNGVDPNYFLPTNDMQVPNSVIYVGGLTWFPNLDAMKYFTSDIWPIIKRELSNATMKHVGIHGGMHPAELISDDDSIEFLGFVDDIRREMTKASVYIVPLRIGGGTRLKIYDAMSMGKAIVSTSIGCEGIDVTDGHDIMIADSPAEFAHKVIQLMQNPDLRDQLGRNARRSVEERFSWKKIAPRLEHTLAEAAAARARHLSTPNTIQED